MVSYHLQNCTIFSHFKISQYFWRRASSFTAAIQYLIIRMYPNLMNIKLLLVFAIIVILQHTTNVSWNTSEIFSCICS